MKSFLADNFFGGKVLKDTIEACLSSSTTDRLRDFMREKSNAFERGRSEEMEHKLEYTLIHREYTELLEECLAEPLRKHKKTAADLYSIAARLQETCEAEMQIFIKLLLAASDYNIFADIMMGGREHQDYFFHILDGWRVSWRRDADRR